MKRSLALQRCNQARDIAAQRREIAEMKALIADIENNGKQTDPDKPGETVTELLLGPKVPPRAPPL